MILLIHILIDMVSMVGDDKNVEQETLSISLQLMRDTFYDMLLIQLFAIKMICENWQQLILHYIHCILPTPT